MRAAAVVALLCVAACGSGNKSGAMCGRGSVSEGMPGSCRTASTLLVCPAGDGFDCGCVTDAQSCPDCPVFRGGCYNACDPDEFAVECGAPPSADAGAVVVFDDPPPTCRFVGGGGGARSAYCCPCD